MTPECCPLCGTPSPRLLVAHIQAVVAAYYDMPIQHMTSAQRSWRFSHPRQVAMYLTSHLTHRSLPDIGLRFRRDHTTVIHAIRTVKAKMETDPELARDVLCLIEQLSPVQQERAEEMAA